VVERVVLKLGTGPKAVMASLMHGIAAGCATQVLVLPMEMVVTRLQSNPLVTAAAAAEPRRVGAEAAAAGSGEVLPQLAALSVEGICGAPVERQQLPPPQPTDPLKEEQRKPWSAVVKACREIHAEGGLPHFWSSLVPALLICLNPGITQLLQVGFGPLGDAIPGKF